MLPPAMRPPKPNVANDDVRPDCCAATYPPDKKSPRSGTVAKTCSLIPDVVVGPIVLNDELEPVTCAERPNPLCAWNCAPSSARTPVPSGVKLVATPALMSPIPGTAMSVVNSAICTPEAASTCASPVTELVNPWRIVPAATGLESPTTRTPRSLAAAGPPRTRTRRRRT